MKESVSANETRGRALFVNDRPVRQENSRSSALDERGLEPLIANIILAIGVICVVAFLVVRPAHVTNSKTADTRPPALASYDSHQR